MLFRSVSSGCILSGGHIDRCVLSPLVRINSYTTVSESVLFEGVEVGRHCRIRRAIIDKGVRVPANTTIGYDAAHDAERGFTVSRERITVVAADARLENT